MNLLKNKLFFISLIFIVIMLGFSVKSQAYIEYTYDDGVHDSTTYYAPDIPSELSNSNYITLFGIDSGKGMFYIFPYSALNVDHIKYTSDDNYIRIYFYDSNDNKINIINTQKYISYCTEYKVNYTSENADSYSWLKNNNTTGDSTCFFLPGSLVNFSVHSSPVKVYDENDNQVFPQPEKEAGILLPVAVEQFPETITAIIKVVIPVAVILVAAMVLIPIIMTTLRKAFGKL